MSAAASPFAPQPSMKYRPVCPGLRDAITASLTASMSSMLARPASAAHEAQTAVFIMMEVYTGVDERLHQALTSLHEYADRHPFVSADDRAASSLLAKTHALARRRV